MGLNTRWASRRADRLLARGTVGGRQRGAARIGRDLGRAPAIVSTQRPAFD